MERITNKHLEAVCERLNKVLDRPLAPWSRVDGQNVANIGNFHISHAYGGVCLHEMCNEHGGVRTPLVYGHVPKRELYNRMHAMLDGIDIAREAS